MIDLQLMAARLPGDYTVLVYRKADGAHALVPVNGELMVPELGGELITLINDAFAELDEFNHKDT